MGLIGTSLKKSEDIPRVTGQAEFSPDIDLPGMLIAKCARSPYAHARIKSIDVTEAKRVRGVVIVLTAKDLQHMGVNVWGQAVIPDQYPLAVDKVIYQGEGVAVVAAEDNYAALDAVEKLNVDYEALPAVVEARKALEPDSPVIHEELQGKHGVKGNVHTFHKVRGGDVVGGFKNADYVFKESYKSAKVSACPLETHGGVASYNPSSRRLTLWTSTQTPHLVRKDLAGVLGWPESRIRVVMPYVGGAFGHKIGLHHNEVLASVLSIKTRRPVKLVLDRTEEFLTTPSRHPHIVDVEAGFKKDGTITAWREKIIQDTGAYSGYGPAVMVLSCLVKPGPYKMPALHVDGTLVYTNKGSAGCYRGFGNPQATFFRESMLDKAARELGLDPYDIRMKNLIRKTDLPYTNCTGLKIKSIAIEDAMQKTSEAIKYWELRKKKEPNIGVGIANMIEWCSCRWTPLVDADNGSAIVKMEHDGSIIVLTDAASSGQGHETMFSQIVNDVLGLPPEKITVIEGDSDACPQGLGTWGSRTAVIHGTAVRRAALKVREEVLRLAAHLLEASPEDLDIEDEKIFVKGTPSKFITVKDVAMKKHFNKAQLPKDMEAGAIIGTAIYDTPTELPNENGIGHFSVNYVNSCHMAVVKADPETGNIDVLDYAIGEDAGRVINPQIVLGQIQGGFAQGFGFALREDLIYDENGTLLNPNYMDYKIPKATDMPKLEVMNKVFEFETHDPETIMGQKGIGESGITNPSGVIACAIYDAIGTQLRELPMTPEKVLRAIKKVP